MSSLTTPVTTGTALSLATQRLDAAQRARAHACLLSADELELLDLEVTNATTALAAAQAAYDAATGE